MIASVQYNDVIGTAAADIADRYFNSLQKFLMDSYSSYDGNRYSCRGCTAYIGERNGVFVSFVCLDKDTNEFVKFTTHEPWSPDQFFDIFKRFEIVIGNDINEVEVPEAKDRIVLNNGEAK